MLFVIPLTHHAPSFPRPEHAARKWILERFCTIEVLTVKYCLIWLGHEYNTPRFWPEA